MICLDAHKPRKKDQKKTDLKVTSNNSETTWRKRESETTILLIFLIINIHARELWPYHCEPPLNEKERKNITGIS